jgi:hypothetical protein
MIPDFRRPFCVKKGELREQNSRCDIASSMKLFLKIPGFIRFFCSAMLMLTVLVMPSARGAVVWDGPLITFNQPSPDPTQATNQDSLTPAVSLTRAASKGLFNAVTETSATTASPAGTEWAFGALTNFSSLTYKTWLNLLNGQSPTTFVGQPLVVHLISDDIYLSVEFTFWGAHASGGFTYQRSTPALVTSNVITLSGGTITNSQFTFSYGATPGSNYVVQVSSDLSSWQSVATNIAQSNLVVFTDTFVSNQNRFYQVSRLPAQ